MSQSGPRFLEWGAFRFPHRASALQRCCSDGLVSVHGVRTQLSLTCGQRRPFLPVYYRAAPIEKGLQRCRPHLSPHHPAELSSGTEEESAESSGKGACPGALH